MFKAFYSLFFLVVVFVNTSCFAADKNEQKLKVGFFLEHLNVRGIEVSTYNYADYNEKILGNESVVVVVDQRDAQDKKPVEEPSSVRDLFQKRFGSDFYECHTIEEMDEILLSAGVDILYLQKGGHIDGKLSKVAKNAVHAVFPPLQVHGDIYAAISKWLSDEYPALQIPYVPYMVTLDSTTETLHEELGIPKGAVVFGRHGGFDSFDLRFAMETVYYTALMHPDWYFLFLNTFQFCNLPNVIFLPATPDLIYKTKFINTCDAMIHARGLGESFGLACAEFSIQNKPVITWSGLGSGEYERSHVNILGQKGLYYNNGYELFNILSFLGSNISSIRLMNWDAYSEHFNPEAVMKKFDSVFIQPLKN